jgi:hypothetical protein
MNKKRKIFVLNLKNKIKLTSSQNVFIGIEEFCFVLFVSSVIKFSTGNKITRGRRRLFNTSFEFAPCVMPAPSAKIFSNSGVAPPVINAEENKKKNFKLN